MGPISPFTGGAEGNFLSFSGGFARLFGPTGFGSLTREYESIWKGYAGGAVVALGGDDWRSGLGETGLGSFAYLFRNMR